MWTRKETEREERERERGVWAGSGTALPEGRTSNLGHNRVPLFVFARICKAHGPVVLSFFCKSILQADSVTLKQSWSQRIKGILKNFLSQKNHFFNYCTTPPKRSWNSWLFFSFSSKKKKKKTPDNKYKYNWQLEIYGIHYRLMDDSITPAQSFLIRVSPRKSTDWFNELGRYRGRFLARPEYPGKNLVETRISVKIVPTVLLIVS